MQKISTVDSAFGTGKFAADYDEEGDAKLRQQHIVQRVFSDLLFFIKMLMFRHLRDFGLRAAIEPSNLHWPDIGMKVIADKNDEFYGRREVDLSNLLQKGEELSLRNCTKQKESFKPNVVENPNDPLCVVNMTCMHRETCSPD